MKFAVLSFMDFCKGGILEFPASLRGSKATEAISRNSSFYFRNSSFLGVRVSFKQNLKFPSLCHPLA